MGLMFVQMGIFDEDNKFRINNLLFSSSDVENRPFYVYVMFVYDKSMIKEVEKLSEKDIRALVESGRSGFINGMSDSSANASTASVVFYRMQVIPNVSTNRIMDRNFNRQAPVKIYVYVDVTYGRIPATKMIPFDGNTRIINNLSGLIF